MGTGEGGRPGRGPVPRRPRRRRRRHLEGSLQGEGLAGRSHERPGRADGAHPLLPGLRYPLHEVFGAQISEKGGEAMTAKLLDTFEGRLRLEGVLVTRTALHIGAGGSGDALGTDSPVVRTAAGTPY